MTRKRVKSKAYRTIRIPADIDPKPRFGGLLDSDAIRDANWGLYWLSVRVMQLQVELGQEHERNERFRRQVRRKLGIPQDGTAR